MMYLSLFLWSSAPSFGVVPAPSTGHGASGSELQMAPVEAGSIIASPLRWDPSNGDVSVGFFAIAIPFTRLLAVCAFFECEEFTVVKVKKRGDGSHSISCLWPRASIRITC